MTKYKDSGAADEFKKKTKQAQKERKQAEKKVSKPGAAKKVNIKLKLVRLFCRLHFVLLQCCLFCNNYLPLLLKTN